MPQMGTDSTPMFHGSIPALITPFKGDKVDEKGFQDFVNWQIEEGSHGLVPVGTTGESPTLSHDEHRRVVELCIEAAAGRVPVIAGAGSNSTAEAVSLAKHAKDAGADGILVVAPYYNKPNQGGMKAHYTAIADAADLPLIIYNIPGRSIIDMTPETMGELAKHPNIAGVKDATGDVLRVHATREACGEDFIILSGEDGLILPQMSLGAHGCISVAANVAPKLCAAFHNAWRAGDLAEAQRLNDVLLPLHKALFSDTSPAPTKYALAKTGRITEETLRLPIIPAHDAARGSVDAALAHAGL